MNILLIYLIIFANFLHSIFSLEKVNYFKDKKKLYYTNVMNDDKGDLYIEYWGEENNLRYFMGISASTGEEIKFGNEKVKIITATVSNRIYHESIIINKNNENNIFSMNYKYYEFINLKNGGYDYKKPDKIYDFTVESSNSFSNSVIKLKNGNYLLSINLSYSSWGIKRNYLYLTTFKFDSTNNMGDFKKIETEYYLIDFVNSTSCFQTEKGYIECAYNTLYTTNNVVSVGIFDLEDLDQNTYYNIADSDDQTFAKIFHIKGEIGGYLYFDIDDYLPRIQIKKLIKSDDDFEFSNLFFDYIVLNGDGKYSFNFNSDLFYSDAIKINDTQFVVMLTSENLLKLLICVFDLYNNDKSLRLRYYLLDLTQVNIKISVNLRALKLGNFFGLSFYNSNTQYAGYTIFNYPNVKKDNNYVNNTIIEIKLFVSDSSYSFSFKEIELINK